MNFEKMVNCVETWFREADIENQEKFLNTQKDKLIIYHTRLGRKIRNEFKLWEIEWKPDISNGVDYSPEHPDQISMKVIEANME
jgi:hypothetical protein